MVVDGEVVRAIAEDLTLEEIKSFRSAAVREALKGDHVVMTSGSFQDQSSAGVFVERNAKEVVALCNAAIDYLEAAESGEARVNPRVNHFDMRGQTAGW